MSPLAVFFRTLSRSSAICLGVGFAIVNPSFEWSPGQTNALTTEMRMTGVTAQNSPSERAVDGLILALKDSDAGVRRQAAIALGADAESTSRTGIDRGAEGRTDRRQAPRHLGARRPG